MSTHPREVVVDVRSAPERPESPATRAADPASDARPARLPESPHRASRGADADDPSDGSSTRDEGGRVHGTAFDIFEENVDPRRLDAFGEREDAASPDWDPVADATMAKILRSVSSTRSGRTPSVSVAETRVEAAGADDVSIEHPRRTSRNTDRAADDLHSGDVEKGRRETRDENTREDAAPTPPSDEKATTSPESFGSRQIQKHTTRPDDPSARGGLGFNSDVTFSRRLLRSATRALFPASAGSASSTPQTSDDDGKPPIRLRRTSSYYVFAAEGASRRASFALSPCGVAGAGVDESREDDATGAFVKEQRARRRREELTRFRRRVADSGKLLASALAGVLAGIALWAMTTATAQLTAAKFDATRDLLAKAARAGKDGSTSGGLVAAWAFYAGCASLCVGATAAYVLRVAPMARGSGIPELKGYLNGNRQRGLFHWRTFVGRSVGICLVITATMPFGREGPSVHIGACAASAALNLVPWRARLGWQPSPEERRQILQLGSAAGVAAAFNAPIGGLLYVMEEVASSLPPDYVWRAMLAAGTAVGVAQILYAANEGRVDYSSLVISDPDSSTGWSPSDLPLVVLLALLAGAFSALFTLAADASGAMRRNTSGGNVRATREGKEEDDDSQRVTNRAWITRIARRARRFTKRVRAWYFSRAGAWFDAVLGAALVATAQVALPALFSCRPAPEIRQEYGSAYNGRRLMGFFSDDVGVFPDDDDVETSFASRLFRRGLLSSAVYVPRTFVQYTCADGDFNEMATLMLQNEEGVVKHLFARDDMYSEELFSPTVVFAFLVYFFLAASLTFGGAFPAGVFIPNMLMGAALGRLFGSVAELVNPNAAPKGTYALIGSAAMLSGFTRMTAAVTVIIIEATASLDVLAPIILACVVSRATAGALVGASLDERLIVAKGVPFLEHDPHPSTVAMKIGDALKEADTRRGPVIAFRQQERLRVLLNALLLTEHNAFPVLEDVERNERVVGLVTRAMLQRVLRMVLEEAEAEEASSGDDKKAKVSSDEVVEIREKNAEHSRMSEALVEIRDGRADGPFGKRSSASSVARFSAAPLIDEWSVEGLGNLSRRSSKDREDLKTSRQTTSRRERARDDEERNDFRVANRRGDLVGFLTRAMGSGPRATSDPRRGHERPLSARVGAAAAAADATPSFMRAGDANHFDELKENLVREIQNGTVKVPESQLRRMVDLTHAVDKAPWTADAATKVGRVHALFARLGVRHLCVTDDNGRRLEGVITRHDLIHVHRSAEGHA